MNLTIMFVRFVRIVTARWRAPLDLYSGKEDQARRKRRERREAAERSS